MYARDTALVVRWHSTYEGGDVLCTERPTYLLKRYIPGENYIVIKNSCCPLNTLQYLLELLYQLRN